MSSLTKKLLFFGVFSIVCSFTTSDVNECKASVYEVFFEGMKPCHHFQFAMFSISESLITSPNKITVGNTQDFLHYFKSNDEAVHLIKHLETISYFETIVNWKNTSLSFSQYNVPLNTKKQYIVRYFKFLVSKFKKTKVMKFINTHAMSPTRFCESDYENEPLCIETLYKMLDVNEPNLEKRTKRFNELKGYDALMYCYEKYHYLDFTMPNFFSEPSSSNRPVQEERIQLAIMATYLNHLTSVAMDIASGYKTLDRTLFLTPEEFCSSRHSTST